MDEKTEFTFIEGANTDFIPAFAYVATLEWHDGPLLYISGTRDGKMYLCFPHDHDEEGGITDAFAEASKDVLDSYIDGKLSLKAVVQETVNQGAKIIKVRYGIGESRKGANITAESDADKFWNYHFDDEDPGIEFYNEHGFFDEGDKASYAQFIAEYVNKPALAASK